MSDSRRAVLEHLARAARARSRRRALWHAATGASVLGGLLLTAIVALSLAPGLRGWLLVALASVAVVASGLTVGALLTRAQPGRTARWIALRDPALGGALADAVEFGAVLDGGGSIRTGSPELAAAHVESAARLARADDPARHARRLAPPPWGSAGAMVAAALLAFVLVPSGRRVLLHGPEPPAPPRVTYGAVELTFRHPAYLRLPDRTETGSGDIEAPAGTHVDVRVRADRPLAAGRIEPSESTPTEMRIDGAVAAGTLVIGKPGTYRIVLQGAAGEIDPEPPIHVLRVIADTAPLVRLRAPRRDVVLDEGEILGVEWSAQDDHGIAEAALVVHRGTSDEDLPSPGAPSADAERIPLGAFDPPEPDRGGSGTFSTDDLGLVPGDVAWLWVEARDDDAVTGPKWDASSRVRIVVRSEEEQVSALRQGQEELAERLLALLASHLVAGPERLTAAAALESHHRSFTTALQAVTALAGDVSAAAESELEDFAAISALQEMRARLDSLLRARMRREPAFVSGSDEIAGTAHAELFDREIAELERDVLFFDMWADRRASMRASDAAENLAAQAAELREQAEETEPEASAEELLSSTTELAESAESLEALLAQLAQAAGADPAAAAEARQMLESLQAQAESLSRQLERGDRSAARRGSERMEELAAELAGRVADLADEGAAGDPELARDIERAEGDLRRLRRDQSDLRDETNRLRDEVRQALSPEDLQRAEEGFAELERLAAEAVAAHAAGDAKLADAGEVEAFFQSLEERARAESRLRELLRDPDGLDDAELRELRALQDEVSRLRAMEMFGIDRVEMLMRASMNARELLGRLQQVISDRDLGAARDPARWALDQVRVLRQAVGEQESTAPAEPDFTTAAARTSEILQRLEDLENQIEQAAQQAMTASQREQLGEAGRRQAQAQQRARELASRLRELGADAPFLGQDVADNVDEAGGFMDDATRGLLARQPGSASEDQGEALARLDQAAESLSPTGGRDDAGGRSGGRGQQQAGREGGGRQEGGRAGEQGRDGRRGRASRERVEIPDADDFRVPREFREEILEAMRESSAPDGYAEQVREYYRRLVE